MKRLVIFQEVLVEFSDLQRIICAFPLLEELRLSTLKLVKRRGYRSSVLRVSPKIKHLHVDHLDYELLLLLVSWVGMGSIGTLDITNYRIFQNLKKVIKFLQIPIASTLECLRLEEWEKVWKYPPASENYSRSFEQLVHFRTLDIRYYGWWDAIDTIDTKRDLCEILSCFASPMLEVIRLQPVLEEGPQNGAARVDRVSTSQDDLHAVLTQTVFDRLAHVTVIFNVRVWRMAVNKNPEHRALGILMSLRVLFAPWLARGIIKYLVAGVGCDSWYATVVAKGDEEPFWIHGEGDRLLASWGI